jgi:NADH:ubiquinone oxidoreductase subunit 6 (subunit J)
MIVIGKCAFIVMTVAMMVTLIRRKRAGQWKRPWSFPVAMTLLTVALVCYSTAVVLHYFGM